MRVMIVASKDEGRVVDNSDGDAGGDDHLIILRFQTSACRGAITATRDSAQRPAILVRTVAKNIRRNIFTRKIPRNGQSNHVPIFG